MNKKGNIVVLLLLLLFQYQQRQQQADRQHQSVVDTAAVNAFVIISPRPLRKNRREAQVTTNRKTTIPAAIGTAATSRTAAASTGNEENEKVSRSAKEEEGGDCDDNILFHELIRAVCGGDETYKNNTTSIKIHLKVFPGGIRGVAASCRISSGEEIVRIPISSCFRPPIVTEAIHDDDNTISERSSLAAALARTLRTETNNNIVSLYKKMLPTAEELRSSLPVRWSLQEMEEIDPLLSRCRRFHKELEMDRIQREKDVTDVMQLLEAKKNELNNNEVGNGGGCSFSREDAHRALDIVETRACRIELPNWYGGSSDGTYSIPIICPVFDFGNHGASNKGSNAYYCIERIPAADRANTHIVESQEGKTSKMTEYYFVVRASRNLQAGEEILYNYGSAATAPSWKCLLNYGFVALDIDDFPDDNDTAEICVDGNYFEVSPVRVPLELVSLLIHKSNNEREASAIKIEGDDGGEDDLPSLTPDIAMCIADLVSLEAQVLSSLLVQEKDDSSNCSVASRLISNLHRAQRNVLLTLASNIMKHGNEQNLWRTWRGNALELHGEEIVFRIQ